MLAIVACGAIGLVACGSSASGVTAAADGSAGSSSGGEPSDGGRSRARDDGGAAGDDASPGPTDGGTSLIDAPVVPASLACTIPIAAASVGTPDTVVGEGGGGCTEAALVAAVKKGGVITFACGGPTTIKLTSQLEFPKGKDTALDGGGSVTLDGGGTTRIAHFDGGGYRTTSTVITLQHLTFTNGHGTGTKLPQEPAPCSQGYDTDAGGGAVLVNDGVLHVVDCTFTNDSGQTPGPDVAGGAVYVNGSKSAVIVGSRFANDTCSNGGAVGSLNSDLAIYTSTLSGNTATGTGQNNTSSKCTSKSTEIGDGGSGGAVYMDGGQDGDTVFCGDVFSKNHANALGGAIFRVFDGAMHDVDLDVSTVDGNVADGPVGTDGAGPGAGAFYFHGANVKVHESTLSNNASPVCGALQADGSTLDFVNVTMSGNVATAGVGGAICIFSNGGTLTNCTLANNQANGGSSYSNFYGAAIFGRQPHARQHDRRRQHDDERARPHELRRHRNGQSRRAVADEQGRRWWGGHGVLAGHRLRRPDARRARGSRRLDLDARGGRRSQRRAGGNGLPRDGPDGQAARESVHDRGARELRPFLAGWATGGARVEGVARCRPARRACRLWSGRVRGSIVAPLRWRRSLSTSRARPLTSGWNRGFATCPLRRA
jgi:hypothetical protein